LRAGAAGLRPARVGHPVRLVQRLGRRRRQGLRLPRVLVQSRRRADGGTGIRAGSRGTAPRPDSRSRAHLIPAPRPRDTDGPPDDGSRRASRERVTGRLVPEAPGRRDGPAESSGYYFFASFFFFTYAQIFFVISEGPMGLLPMTSSSVSLHPLKLIA